MVIEPQSVRAIIVTLKWRNVFFYYFLLSGWRRRTRVIWHYWKFHFSVGSRVIHGVHQFIREWCVKLRFTSKLSGNTNPAHKDAFNSLISDLKKKNPHWGRQSVDDHHGSTTNALFMEEKNADGEIWFTRIWQRLFNLIHIIYDDGEKYIYNCL